MGLFCASSAEHQTCNSLRGLEGEGIRGNLFAGPTNNTCATISPATKSASLLRAAKKSRHGACNYAMILLAYRHGLRASELVNLRVSDLDLRTWDHLLPPAGYSY